MNGNRASVTIEASVPESPAPQLETQLEVRSNGNQRFHVPVVLHIMELVASAEEPAAPAAGPAANRLVTTLVAVLLSALVLNVAAIALWLLQPLPVDRLREYAAAVSARTCAVFEADVGSLEEVPGLETDMRRLRSAVEHGVQDLNLQPRGVRPRRVFVALAPKARPVTVWTFDRPEGVQFGPLRGGTRSTRASPSIASTGRWPGRWTSRAGS